ncbi:MAG: hypothetical protein CEE38_06045 [Planctomycetes bacterium B3_Pla]|nr:MAG: hypothetical protein CEE38_06045 [Planctomycetes bacterium B3_Pla]
MLTAYVDESGYTGRNLLCADQPFMSLAAVFVSQDDAAAIRSRHFPRSNAPELKHKSLSKRPNYYDPLLSVQSECLNNHKGISYVVDKKYMCILKMLDDCIEPVWYAMGVDFYQNGQHLALASLIYATSVAFWGDGSLDRLLSLYQEAAHIKTKEAITSLSAFAKKLQGRELSECLAPISFMHPEFVENISSPRTSTNIAFTLLSGLINRLEQSSQDPYIVHHDRSDAMRHYHGLLKAMCNDTAPAEYRISDVSQVSYPLKLYDVEEGDSKEQFGLQLADLLAGGVISGARAAVGLDMENEYNTKVLTQYSDENFMHMIPETDFKETARRFANNDISTAIIRVASNASRQE